MVQPANTFMHVQQVGTLLECIEHEYFSTLSEQPLLDIQARWNAKTTGTITLDCGGLESMSSHTICLFIKLLVYAKCQKKRLQVLGLSEHNRYIFEITRLNKFLDIVETENRSFEPLHL